MDSSIKTKGPIIQNDSGLFDNNAAAKNKKSIPAIINARKDKSSSN